MGVGERVRFELLGPLRARRVADGGTADGGMAEGHEVPLGPPRQRAVLAVLLLQEGRPISFGGLVDAVWGPEAPAQVRNLVQKYVSGIRRALPAAENAADGPGGVDGTEGAGGPARTPELSWTGSGYRLTGASVADLAERGELIRAALRARNGGDLRAAVDLAARAEELWRGEFAEGLAGPYLAAERARWAEKRLTVLEERLAGLLELGRYHECVHELVRQAAAHPLRERLTGLLMLALYRSGQPSAALLEYARARERIGAETGAEPGPRLRQLHERMLRQDPGLLPGGELVA